MINRLKGAVESANAYLDSLTQFIQQQYPGNSIPKAVLYPSVIGNKLKNDDLTSVFVYLDDYKKSITSIAGDTSTLMIDYYLQLSDYYDAIGNTEEQQITLIKADSMIINAFGHDSGQRISILFKLGGIYFHARQWEKHSQLGVEQKRLLLLNQQNNSSWFQNYKYNLGYSCLSAVMQKKYAEADELFLQFEQAISADDPDFAIHLSECASLASLVNNPIARSRFLRLANDRILQDKKLGKYKLSTHLSITDQLVEDLLKRGECDSAAHYLGVSRILSDQNTSPNDGNRLLYFAQKDLELCDCRGCDQEKRIELQEKQLALQAMFNRIDVYLYRNLASDYRAIGAYDRADLYQVKMLDLLKKYASENMSSPAEQVEYLMAAGVYTSDTIYGLDCYLKADSIAQKHQLPATVIHSRLHGYYTNKDQYKQAIYWGKKLKDDYALERLSLLDSLNQILNYSNLAQTYWLAGNSATSNEYYQLSYDLLKQHKYQPNSEATAYEKLSYWRRTQGDYQGAIDFAQKGLRLLNMPSFDEGKASTQPELVRNLYHRITRAYGDWYDATGIMAYNDSAYVYADYALRTLNAQSKFAYLMDQNALQYRHTAYVKFTFEEHLKVLSIRSKAVNPSNAARQAFSVNEQWRAPAFRQEVQDRRLEKKSGLVRQMRENGLMIDKNQTIKFQSEQAGLPSHYYSDVLERLDNLYKEQENLRREYDGTQDFNNQKNIATIEQIQTQLRKDQRTYVSYFLTDSMLTTFVVKTDTFFMICRTGNMTSVRIAANQLRRELGTEKLNKRKFAQSAAALYDTLIRPIERWLTHDLVIVPDGALSVLPFEVLFTKNIPTEELADLDCSQMPFLMFQHDIVYAQSATVWLEMLRRKTKPSTELLGMAPSYAGLKDDPGVRYWRFDPGIGSRSGLDPLRHTRQEIEDVAGAISKPNPRMYKGPDAKSKVFFQEASLARIIHLAIHAKGFESLGDYSYLVFAYPDSIHKVRVFARDVASMRLNADMVVLSGCETGQGSNYTGEGVVGLGRAFSVAGAKSVVLSLWNVDDQSTSTLMKQYYANLKAGQSKGKAMNNARRTLINQGYAPYFWAPFVVYGDAGVMRF